MLANFATFAAFAANLETTLSGELSTMSRFLCELVFMLLNEQMYHQMRLYLDSM